MEPDENLENKVADVLIANQANPNLQEIVDAILAIPEIEAGLGMYFASIEEREEF